MPRRSLPRPQPGDFITAQLFQTFFDEIRRLQISLGANLNMIEGPGGISLRATCEERFVIKITGAAVTTTAGAVIYPWTEQLPAAGGGWQDGPRTGTTSVDGSGIPNGDPAVETTDNDAVANGKRVIASRVQEVLGFTYRKCGA